MHHIVRKILYVSSILLIVLVFAAGYKNIREKQTENQAVSNVEIEESGQSKAAEDTTAEAAENMEEAVENEESAAVSETENARDTEETGAVTTDTVADTTEREGETVLLFTGDILIGNSVSGNYSAGGIDKVLSEGMQNLLRNADITMVNEEFPFGTRGTAMEDKQYTFRVNPSYVTMFQDMGVDIVSLANNHVLDFGTEALEDTFVTLDDAGILYVGAGATRERAMELKVIEKNGKKFGFLAASRVIPVASWNVENQSPGVFATYDATALNAAITEAKQNCDYVTVFVHWGLEHKEYPEDYERTLAAGYVDAGADLVIGSHSHCLQGVEYINGKPVFYSLGNFLFGQNGNTAAVKVTVTEDGGVQYSFVAAKEEGAYTRELTGMEAKSLYSYLDSISFHASVDENGVLSEE